MEKKKVSYILFAIAGGDLISTLIVFFIFRLIALRMGIPSNWMMISSVLILTGLIPVIILIGVGLYIYIRYRHE